MNGVVDVGQVAHVILGAGDLLGIGKKPRHLFFCAAIPQLEVVEHGVVLLGKSLVGILDRIHAGAHLVCVIRHIGQCHIGNFCGLVCVAAEPLQQAGGKSRHRLHIIVGRQAGRFVGFVGILSYLAGVVFKKCLNAADALLEVGSL